MYTYKANVVRVIDGDTVVASVDLGFYIHLHDLKFRFLGINAPEIHGDSKERGLITKNRVEELIMNQEIIIKTEKTDSFGRWLAEVWKDGVSINNLLLAEGLAQEYGG